jgi:hypothetical protein
MVTIDFMNKVRGERQFSVFSSLFGPALLSLEQRR